MAKNINSILKDLKKGLKDIYRLRLKGLFLFGSYARGEADLESDLDVAAILDDYKDVGKEIENVGGLVSKLSLKNNIVISFHPVRETDFANRKTPFILNLKREGVSI